MRAYKQPFGFYYFAIMLPLDVLAFIALAITSKTVWAAIGYVVAAIVCYAIWHWMVIGE